MKSTKYLNGILTIIAFCLVLITLAVTGLIPTASAKEKTSNFRYATIPVNSDGTINVKFAPNETIDVNIEDVGGYSTYGKVPVEIKN